MWRTGREGLPAHGIRAYISAAKTPEMYLSRTLSQNRGLAFVVPLFVQKIYSKQR